jgi:O-antigen ligase
MRQMVGTETRPNLLHMGEGMWLGLAIGIVYLAIEFASHQSIKIWLYNLLDINQGELAPLTYFKWKNGDLVRISSDDLSRNMAPLALFLWPAVAALIGSRTRFRATWAAAALVAAAIAVIMVSRHESSKVAVIGGVLTFTLAYFAPRAAGRVMVLGWVCACLAVLPGVLLAHRLELQKASWIQNSAKHRFIIWNYTAEQVLKSPLFGVGARTTYVLGPQLEEQHISGQEDRFRRTLSTHSHSVYLQTWFELGLVGAALLTLLGLSILQAVSALSPRKQPYAYATFASAAIMAASSFGIWQFWFMALFGYCVMLFGVGSRLLDDSPDGVAEH